MVDPLLQPPIYPFFDPRRSLEERVSEFSNHFMKGKVICASMKCKISATPRCGEGRRCSDTFAQKDCREHGLSFWEYLKDQFSGTGLIPRLADPIDQAANL